MLHIYLNLAVFGTDPFALRDVNLDLRSSGMLRSVEWLLVTVVSKQPIGPIFKDQETQEGLDFLILDNGTDRLFRKSQ